jgi:glycosyltransferase involved in cell wall biosynthesis
MRIVHIATLASPDGAYGGPVRVATNLVKELEARGDDVLLWAGAQGYPRGTNRLDGARVHLFPAHVAFPPLGFSTTLAPGMLSALIAERRRIDVLHIHLARDLVTLPVALLARALRIPYVVQTHGMIQRKHHPLARAFDVFLTRTALRGAASILNLTREEQQQLHQVDPQLHAFSQLAHGIEAPPTVIVSEKPGDCEVLFLARMHARKRPQFFVNAAVDILSRGRRAVFHLVGPDEGEAATVSLQISASNYAGQIVYEGPLAPDRTNARMARCDLYVLPSVDEPFGMSAMEAMALGKPVIVTDSCGLAPYVQAAGAGLVVDAEQQSLTAAIDRLIEDAHERLAMGTRARQLVQQEFSMRAVGERLSAIYSKTLN